MKIDCEKAGQLMEQEEFEKLGFWERRRLRMHVKVCECCSKYQEDNSVLAKVIRMAGIKFSKNCISEEEKAKIKEYLANNA
jgi:hypothetical protein